MKIKTIRAYVDKDSKKLLKIGEIADVKDERGAELIKLGYAEVHTSDKAADLKKEIENLKKDNLDKDKYIKELESKLEKSTNTGEANK